MPDTAEARADMIEDRRRIEHEKYARSYASAKYRMGEKRMRDALHDLRELECRGSYLDVGCGRGEMLDHACAVGFEVVRGVEVVPDLIDGARVVRGEAHALPFADDSFDVVSLFDVIEHLLPGDDERVCRELARVARRHVLLTANNKPSHNVAGDDLHINRRSYPEWDLLFRSWFAGTVTWLRTPQSYVSERWRVDL